jgi:hypothetical protein
MRHGLSRLLWTSGRTVLFNVSHFLRVWHADYGHNMTLTEEGLTCRSIGRRSGSSTMRSWRQRARYISGI